MLVENLSVGRVVMHEVFQRTDGNAVIRPTYGTTLEALDGTAIEQFAMRITDALATQSKSIEMKVVKSGAGSLIDLGSQLVVAAETGFVNLSAQVADALADAQRSRAIPGGMLLVFDGTVGARNLPYFGVIKAEFQSGFRRSRAGSVPFTEFLDNIFLTPATRLYKLALFASDAIDVNRATAWRAFVFDSNITATKREGAAIYFYDGFLGCALPEDGKYETPKFFDLTREFVRQAVPDTELKRDLNDALFSFIKLDQNPTFTSQEFADTYLPLELRDSFRTFLQKKNFPVDRAVVRDVSEMANRLRRRKYRFGTDIEFSVSPEAIRSEVVKIEEYSPEDSRSDGLQAPWTRITIKRPATEQL